MADDKTPDNRGDDPGDAQAVATAFHERWLGDYKLINSLLRSFAFKNMDRAGSGNADAFTAQLDTSARNLAQTLLGQNEKFPGPKWFSPGMIDAYVAQQASIDSNDPEERIAGALLGMFTELLSTAQSTSDSNLLGEQWQWQATAIIDSYTKMLLGIPEDTDTENKDKSPAQPPSKTPPQVKPSPFAARK